jgi:DNA replication protein DnaC
VTDAPEILLSHHLKTLKLPMFLREYEKLARQCATEGLDHVRFLARLVELELIDRERRMIERRIKAARFPAVKSLDSFDFKAIPAELLFELISQRYERGSTLITSNLPFDEWTETFGSERLTGALLDRLTHHVTILEMNGDSYRLAQGRERKTSANV